MNTEEIQLLYQELEEECADLLTNIHEAGQTLDCMMTECESTLQDHAGSIFSDAVVKTRLDVLKEVRIRLSFLWNREDNQ